MSGERIETAGELDALPVGSVVVEGDHTAPDPWISDGVWTMPGVFHRFPDGWYVVAGYGAREVPLPATVLCHPDRDLIAEAETRGAREADAALTKALGQRDAVAVTAERMTSYARQAEAVLREVAALHTTVQQRKMHYEWWACDACDYPATGPDDYCPTAILARAEQPGDDR